MAKLFVHKLYMEIKVSLFYTFAQCYTVVVILSLFACIFIASTEFRPNVYIRLLCTSIRSMYMNSVYGFMYRLAHEHALVHIQLQIAVTALLVEQWLVQHGYHG